MATAYRLNTNTGLLVPVTRNLNPAAHLVDYDPTPEEVRLGRKLERVPEVRPHEPEPVTTEFVDSEPEAGLESEPEPDPPAAGRGKRKG